MTIDAAGGNMEGYARLWCAISRDFNGLRRDKDLVGSVDGQPRLFMTPGDGIKFNLLSRRWHKWLTVLADEPLPYLEALAFLAAANEKSIELRMGMAWKGLAALAGLLTLQKLDMPMLLGDAVRDLASYGAVGGIVLVSGWVGVAFVLTYMLLNHFWRINASELRTCVDLALLRRKSAGQAHAQLDASKPRTTEDPPLDSPPMAAGSAPAVRGDAIHGVLSQFAPASSQRHQ